MQVIENNQYVIIGVGDKFAWLDKASGDIGQRYNSVTEAIAAGRPAAENPHVQTLLKVYAYLADCPTYSTTYREDVDAVRNMIRDGLRRGA